MDEKAYTLSLETKTIEEITNELMHVNAELDMLFTVNNSLDAPDITEGGGDPTTQQRYKDLAFMQKALKIEINKRHLMELIK